MQNQEYRLREISKSWLTSSRLYYSVLTRLRGQEPPFLAFCKYLFLSDL